MEDSHDNIEVLTVDEHAAERWRESKEVVAGPSEATDAPVIKTSETCDNEDESDFTSILLPVDSKERRVLLRRSGVAEIDTKEKEDCRELRVSRQTCGCDCQLYCLPDTCPCAKFNIKCQVDRPGFPCSCTAEGCLNKKGRLEFNPVKVRTHFVRTIMRTRLEAARYLTSQHNCSSYLPSGTLGYLAQMYTQQEMASTSSSASLPSSSQYSDTQNWLQSPAPGSWSIDNPWWTYSAEHQDQGDTGEHYDDTQADTETSESEEEIYAEVIDEEEEEEIEETVVTDDIHIAYPAPEDDCVSDIIDDIITSVVSDTKEAEGEVSVSHDEVDGDDTDEGISSDQSYYEDTSATQTDTESGKCEEDSSDRSEGFVEDVNDDKSDLEESSPSQSISSDPNATKLVNEILIESDLTTNLVGYVPA